jgi:predicted ArsR family transcriptional regulator
VAGHMLAFSLRHPELSLKQALGMTLGTKPAMRSPIRRVEILEELITRDGPTSVKQLTNDLSQNYESAEHHIKRLVDEGLLVAEEAQDKRGDILYQAPDDAQEQFAFGQREPRLARLVVAEVTRRTVDGQSMSRNAIVEHFQEYEQYKHTPYNKMSNRVSIVLNEMVRQGMISPVKYDDKKIVLVHIAPGHLEAMEDLVTLMDHLRKPTPEFIEAGMQAGQAIITDPESVRTLLAKGLENSPQANGVPLEERRARVATFLQTHRTATATEVATALKTEGLTVVSARKTLANMLKLGIVECAIDSATGRGGSKVWSLASSESTTSTD